MTLCMPQDFTYSEFPVVVLIDDPKDVLVHVWIQLKE
jgi:hypothetical protein